MNYNKITNPNFWDEPRPLCNCGSFALGVDTWFAPYGNEDCSTNEGLEAREIIIASLHEEGASVDAIMSILLEMDQEEILRECPWLEPILEGEIKEEDTVVAYRLSLNIDEEVLFEIDEDYHFRIRKQGVWMEKCGDGEVIQCAEQDWDDFRKPWHLPHNLIYSSDIVYFRHKEKI